MDGLSFEPALSATFTPFIEAFIGASESEKEQFHTQLEADKPKPEPQTLPTPAIAIFPLPAPKSDISHLADPSLKKYQAVMLAALELEARFHRDKALTRGMVQDILSDAGREKFSTGGLIQYLIKLEPQILINEPEVKELFRLTEHGRNEAVKLKARLLGAPLYDESAAKEREGDA